MMYCPTCRDLAAFTNNPVLMAIELMRDMDMIRCANGHTFPDYNALMAMNPTKIRLAPQDIRQPGDVKVEFWVDGTILAKFRERFPFQQNSTVQSILSLYCLGEDPVIIDGVQAKKLREMGVKNGQEIIAEMGVKSELQAEIDGLKQENKTIRSMVREQMRDEDAQ